MSKKYQLPKGPKLKLDAGNPGIAGGLSGTRATPLIKSYADYKKLHFAPQQGTRIKLG